MVRLFIHSTISANGAPISDWSEYGDILVYYGRPLNPDNPEEAKVIQAQIDAGNAPHPIDENFASIRENILPLMREALNVVLITDEFDIMSVSPFYLSVPAFNSILILLFFQLDTGISDSFHRKIREVLNDNEIDDDDYSIPSRDSETPESTVSVLAFHHYNLLKTNKHLFIKSDEEGGEGEAEDEIQVDFLGREAQADRDVHADEEVQHREVQAGQDIQVDDFLGGEVAHEGIDEEIQIEEDVQGDKERAADTEEMVS